MTLPINTVIMLVLGVILLVAIAGGGIPMIRAGMEDVLKWMRGEGVGPIGSSANLIDAIKCSYLRCSEGCDEATTAYYYNFDCSKYCDAKWTDDGTINGKICGDRAKIHPIIVGIDKRGPISISDLDFIGGCPGAECCIVVDEKLRKTPSALLSNKLTVQDIAIDNVVEGKKCGYGGDIVKKCTDERATNCGAREVELKANSYYIWTDKFAVTKVWTKNPIEKTIEIVADKLEEIEIKLAGTMSYSDIYKIIVKSDGEDIDEAILKVEGLDTKERCPDLKDHPRVTFACKEEERWDEKICVDKPFLVCGKFLLTFKKYTGVLKNEATFDIKYIPFSKQFVCCSDKNWYEGTTCPTGKYIVDTLDCEGVAEYTGCEQKCDNEGYKYAAYEYEDPSSPTYRVCTCNTPTAPTTITTTTTPTSYTYCCSYLTNWYCVTSEDCETMGGIKWETLCSSSVDCEGL